MTTNVDRVYAVLCGGESTHEQILSASHPHAPYSRDEADLDNIDYGIAVGAAYVIERLAEPLRSQSDAVEAAMIVAVDAWRRASAVGGEVK